MLTHQWCFLGHEKLRNYKELDRENKRLVAKVGDSFAQQRKSLRHSVVFK